jgi:endothelin-converting enzyme/putative endopeptidase
MNRTAAALVPLLTLIALPALVHAAVRGVPVANLDRSVAACTDFDAFANGQWRATHPMPAIQTSWAIRTVTQENTRERLRAIAEEDAGKAAAAPKGSAVQLTGDFYAGCMDESRIATLALTPLDPLLKAIAGIHTRHGLNAQIVRLQQVNIAAPLALSAEQDPHEPSRMIAAIEVRGLGMPDRDYYLRDEPRFREVREQ